MLRTIKRHLGARGFCFDVLSRVNSYQGGMADTR